MIFHPKPGQKVKINYKDKSMPFQGITGKILAVANNKGPRNVLVMSTRFLVIIPRGNLINDT